VNEFASIVVEKSDFSPSKTGVYIKVWKPTMQKEKPHSIHVEITVIDNQYFNEIVVKKRRYLGTSKTY